MSKIYLNIILTLLFFAVIFMGIAVVKSNDRLFFSNQDILKKLDMQSSVTIAQIPQNNVDINPKEVVANQEFFDKNAQYGGRLIRTISADTKNLNYLINNDSMVSSFYSLCNMSLAERNYQNIEEFQGLLAESWEILDNGMSYLIKLRKGVFWQSFTDVDSGKNIPPKEVTSEDFKFFIDVIKNKDVNCAPLRVYYQDLEDIEIIDKYVFKVKWNKRYFGSFASTLAMAPLPKHFYLPNGGTFDGKVFNLDHKRNRMLIGTGPYKFVKWEKDSRIIFTQDSNFWGTRYGIKPPIKDLSFELIKHPNTRFQALTSGKIDQLNLTPVQWQERTSLDSFAKANLKKYRYLSNSYFYIGYNFKNPFFKNKFVRQAMTHLVNREKIIKDIYCNEAEIITGPFFKNSKYYDAKIKPLEYSIAKAKELLKKAGWEDKNKDGILENKQNQKFEFTILAIASHPIQEKMLPLIQESMAQAGVDMKIQTVEWSVYVQRLENKNFDACTLGWTTAIEPNPYQLWHSSQADLLGSSNHISFKNKTADKLIEQLQVTFDLKKRIELAHQFHQLIHEEQPYTFLFSPFSLNAVSKRYKNVQGFPNSYPSDIWWVPKKEQRTLSGF